MTSPVPPEFECPISKQIMQDPVILECGHTFDRQPLGTWLESSQDCPTCRKPVNMQKITPNYSLKSMISQLNSSRPTSAASIYKPEYQVDVDDKVEKKLVNLDSLKKVKGTFYTDDSSDLVQVCLQSPSAQKRSAVSFVCVIDVSGSMGSIVGAGEGGKAFTRLDLVKHVMNVLIVSLTDQDSLSVITYSTETRLLCDQAMMTKENKRLFKSKIQMLQTENSTYTGQAIKLAYEIIGKAPQDSIRSIILLTDGQDSEGYSILERKFTTIKKDPQVQFNTFGFSNDIESALLEKLALIGGGIFGFIPDQSMIGTIFINFIANTFQLFAQNVLIQINTKNFEFLNTSELLRITMKYGNSRNIILKRKNTKSHDNPTIKIGFTESEMIDVPLQSLTDSETFKDQKARYDMIELCSDANISDEEIKAYEKGFKSTPSFLKELNQGRDSDQNNEQISLGFKNWRTWGAHYIRSFKVAHLHEQCLNFKSPSMKIYTNENFDERVDNLTDLFCTLPPPKPTGINYNHSVNQPKLNMRNIMNADAGCILGSCIIKLAEGFSKPLIDIKKGDTLIDGSKVICNLITKFHGEMCKIGDLAITPYHPIIFKNQWQLPIDIVIANKDDDPIKFQIIKAPEPNWVCTLVLNKNHVINAEGYRCISLGHGFTEEVLKHEFFGTDKILNNLRELRGWERGVIRLKGYKLQRDIHGCVQGMVQPIYAA